MSAPYPPSARALTDDINYPLELAILGIDPLPETLTPHFAPDAVDRIHRVLYMIATEPRRLDMSEWVQTLDYDESDVWHVYANYNRELEPACKTTACFAGWTVLTDPMDLSDEARELLLDLSEAQRETQGLKLMEEIDDLIDRETIPIEKDAKIEDIQDYVMHKAGEMLGVPITKTDEGDWEHPLFFPSSWPHAYRRRYNRWEGRSETSRHPITGVRILRDRIAHYHTTGK